MIPARLSLADVFYRNTFRIITSIICGLGIALIAVFLKQKSLVIITCLGVYLLSGLIIYISQGRLKIFTPSSLFFAFYSLMLFVGSLILYYHTGNLQLPAIVTAAIFFYSLGVIGGSMFLKFKPRKEFHLFVTRPWHDFWQNLAAHVALWVLITFALSLAGVYFYRFGMPIFSSDVEKVRLYAIRNSSYLFPGFQLLILFGLAIVMIKSQLYKSQWLILELVLIPTAFFFFFASGFRAPIAALIIYFFISRQFYQGKLNWKEILALTIVFLIIFGIITWERYRLGFPEKSLVYLPSITQKALYHRVLLNNALNLQFILNFFPHEHAYLYGVSYLMDLKAVAPGSQIAFGGWLTTKMRPELTGIAGVTPTIIGEFYANFGILGVLIGLFCFGFISQAVYICLIRGQKRIGKTVMLIFLSVGMAWTLMLGVGNFLFSKLVPILIVFTLLELTIWLKPLKKE